LVKQRLDTHYQLTSNVRLITPRQRPQELNESTPDFIFQTLPESSSSSSSNLQYQDCVIVDAYDGTSEAEIDSKLRRYHREFPHSRIYVFASNVSHFQHSVLGTNQYRFSFYRMKENINNDATSIDDDDDDDDDDDEAVNVNSHNHSKTKKKSSRKKTQQFEPIDTISISDFTLDIREINQQYKDEYVNFYADVLYWFNNINNKTIVKSRVDEEVEAEEDDDGLDNENIDQKED
jgi:hypothetical protein